MNRQRLLRSFAPICLQALFLACATGMVTQVALAQAPSIQVVDPNQRYLTADVETQRFDGDDSLKGPQLAAGDQVILVHTVGNRARVMKGTSYGWLDASLLTQTKPEAPVGGGLLNPSLGGLGNVPLTMPKLGEGMGSAIDKMKAALPSSPKAPTDVKLPVAPAGVDAKSVPGLPVNTPSAGAPGNPTLPPVEPGN